jgi:hypothetical protein
MKKHRGMGKRVRYCFIFGYFELEHGSRLELIDPSERALLL